MPDRCPHRPLLVVALLATAGLAALAPTGTAQEGAGVTLAEQSSGGLHVVVAQASLPEGGFVVLRSADDASHLRGVSSYLPAGTHDDVVVRLAEPLLADAALVATAYRDGGDRVFRHAPGGGTVDEAYNGTSSQANVTASATIELQAQPTDGASVFVDAVETVSGGFVVVDNGTATVGASDWLPPGRHEDLRVTLDVPQNGSVALTATAYRDDGDRSLNGTDAAYGGPDVRDSAVVTRTADASLDFSDQDTGGHLLVVAEAFLPDGGFVAVRDDNGTLGASKRLAPGLHRDVEVRLDEPLDASTTVVATAHRDDGDGAFQPNGTDEPYTGPIGTPVEDVAEAHLSASVLVRPHGSDGHAVLVERVDLSAPGSVAVHDPGPARAVLGTSDAMAAGVHRDVLVTLDEVVTESRDLVAVARSDSVGNGTGGAFLDASGESVSSQAHVVVPAAVDLEDQSSDGTVVVAVASLPDGGFVALHDPRIQSGDLQGSLVGVSALLEPGVHAYVSVPVEADAGTHPLTAVPYRDDGDGVLQFGNGTDAPYAALLVQDRATITIGGNDADDDATGGGDTDDTDDADDADNDTDADGGRSSDRPTPEESRLRDGKPWVPPEDDDTDGTDDTDGDGATGRADATSDGFDDEPLTSADEGEDAPGPALGLLLAALVGAVAWRRR